MHPIARRIRWGKDTMGRERGKSQTADQKGTLREIELERCVGKETRQNELKTKGVT